MMAVGEETGRKWSIRFLSLWGCEIQLPLGRVNLCPYVSLSLQCKTKKVLKEFKKFYNNWEATESVAESSD